MTPKIHTPHTKKETQSKLVYDVVRPQRKVLSRYKLKKQAGIIEQILDDPLIVDG